MTIPRPFVADPPRPGIDHVDGILMLDIDGVLNILGDAVDSSALPTVPGSKGRPLPIRMVADDVLDVLEAVVRRPGVWLGWLTTWGATVSHLEEIMGDRLSGGFVVSERPSGYYVPADWKLKGALQLIEKHPGARVAWADDDAFAMGSPSGLPAGSLVIAPRPELGLTLGQAQRIAAHLTQASDKPKQPTTAEPTDDELRPLLERLTPIAEKHGWPERDVLYWLRSPTTYFADEQRPVDHLDEPDEIVRIAAQDWGVIW